MVTVQYLNCLVPVRGRQGAAGVGVVHADPGRVDHVAAVVEILLVKHFNNWRISISNFHTSKLQNCCILASVNCGLFLKRNRFGDRDFEKRFEALKHKILSSTLELNKLNFPKTPPRISWMCWWAADGVILSWSFQHTFSLKWMINQFHLSLHLWQWWLAWSHLMMSMSWIYIKIFIFVSYYDWLVVEKPPRQGLWRCQYNMVKQTYFDYLRHLRHSAVCSTNILVFPW